MQLFDDVLRGGKTVTRPDLMALLEATGVFVAGGRGYHLLWRAAQEGQIYIGPMAGKQQTFGLVADLPAEQRPLAGKAALAELVQRYFTSHGPATIKDFAWWSGQTTTAARKVVAELALPSGTCDGVTYYWTGALGGSVRIPGALLLPGFDEYMLGYQDRSLQLDSRYAGLIVPGSNGMFLSTVVLDGRIAGTWKRSVKARHVDLDVMLFSKISAADRKSIAQAADSYGAFLGIEANLTF